MRNLSINRTRPLKLSKNTIAFCIDADEDLLIILTDQLQLFKSHLQDSIESEQSLTLVEHEFEDLDLADKDNVICFEYVVEFSSVLIALRDGRIFRIGVKNNDAHNYLLTHDKDLDSVRLSPDQEILAIADKYNDIYLLRTNDFQVINESNAATNSNSVNKQVGVGWGAKETQFFGLDGRLAKESETTKDQVVLSDQDKQLLDTIESCDQFKKFIRTKTPSTILDWRGDGQWLASLTYIVDKDQHQLKTWNRNLVLQFMSEFIIDLERGVLSYVPNGYFLCCAQRRKKVINEILLLEKNGMIHFRIQIPTIVKNLYVTDLSWSPDSQILAIVGKKFDITSKGGQKVKTRTMLLLYTMSNSQYHLKHSRYLNSDEDQEEDHFLRWNPNDSLCLHIVSSQGNHVEYRLNFQVTYSSYESTVAVIDGNKLKITPFKYCSIPPPMSAYTIELDSLIQSFMFCRDFTSCKDLFLIQTVDGKILIPYESSKRSDLQHWITDKKEDAKNFKIVDLESENAIRSSFFSQYLEFSCSKFSHYDLFALHEHKYCWICSRLQGNVTHIDQVFIRNCEVNTLATFDSAQAIWLNISNDCFRALLTDGRLAKMDLEDYYNEMIIHYDDFVQSSHQSPVLTSRKAHLLFSSFADTNSFDLNLSHDNMLSSRNAGIIEKSCGSFWFGQKFLIYTNLTNSTLNIITLTKKLPISRDSLEYEFSKPWTRPIENGAEIIIVLEDDAKVILQMPRGNLEIIHPRLMVLCLIEQQIIQGKFEEAVETARRHRVNTNFIFDCLLQYKPTETNNYNVKEAISKLANVLDTEKHQNLLVLLINELEQESTFFERYKTLIDFIPNFRERHNLLDLLNGQDRIDKVCDSIPERLDITTANGFHKPTLMCLVKQARFGQALCRLRTLQDKTALNEAIKFLLYYINIDDLLKEAISTYDTDLALMIATKSNKDPKEYLPLLDRFNAIESKYWKYYEMDLHVGNFGKALEDLLKYYFSNEDYDHKHSNPFPPDNCVESIIELIDKKRLYTHGYELVLKLHHNIKKKEDKPNETILVCLLESITLKHADYMLEKRYYIQAGVLYSNSLYWNPTSREAFTKGVNCFELGERCDLSLTLYAQARVDPEIRKTALKRLTNYLIEKGKPLEAFIISSNTDAPITNSPPESDDSMEKSRNFFKMGLGGIYFADLISNASKEIRILIKKQICDCYKILIQELWPTELDEAKENYERLKGLLLEYWFKKTESRNNEETNSEAVKYGIGGDSQLGSSASSTSSLSEASSRHYPGGLKVDGSSKNPGSIKTNQTTKTTKSQQVRKKRLNFKRGSRYEDIALILNLRQFIENQKQYNESAYNILVALHQFHGDDYELVAMSGKVRKLMDSSEIFVFELIVNLWPSDKETDLHYPYCLYERFHDALDNRDSIESVDIEILVRPSRIKGLDYFNINTG